jgi:uncharacterized protein with FMN-binding domain
VRRGIKFVMSVASVVVVGLGLRASTQPATHAISAPAAQPTKQPARARPRTPSRSTARTTPGRTTPTHHATSTPTPSARPSKSVTVAGDVVQTQYGPVQVEISVRSGKITQARALQQPSGDGQTDSINSYAVPQLDQEALAAQSAQIDTVSGASFTSDGYQRSLQSALDAAHRAGAK